MKTDDLPANEAARAIRDAPPMASPDAANPPLNGNTPTGTASVIDLDSFPLAGDLVQFGTKPDEIVEGMLVSGTTVVVAGLPKLAQKTWLAMLLALCVSRGDEFLGQAVKQRRTFYCFLEDSKRRVGWRFKVMGLGQGDPAPVRCIFVSDSSQLFAALDRELMQQKKRVANGEDERPFLLIVDALINYAYSQRVENENDSIEMSKLIEGLRRFTRESQNSIVLIHHFRRAGDAMRGSGAVQASSDGWWDVTQADDTTRRIDTTLRDLPSMTVGFETRTMVDGSFQFTTVDAADLPEKASGNAKPNRRDEVRAKTEAILKQSPQKRWSRNGLAGEVGCSPNTMVKVLEELARDGRARQDDDGWVSVNKGGSARGGASHAE